MLFANLSIIRAIALSFIPPPLRQAPFVEPLVLDFQRLLDVRLLEDNLELVELQLAFRDAFENHGRELKNDLLRLGAELATPDMLQLVWDTLFDPHAPLDPSRHFSPSRSSFDVWLADFIRDVHENAPRFRVCRTDQATYDAAPVRATAESISFLN
jgi:hypothetical protein